MTEREIDECAARLRAEHFAQAHTDMIGDEEERRGYLKGIEALATALKKSLRANGEPASK
jgi:hypothetical protein